MKKKKRKEKKFTPPPEVETTLATAPPEEEAPSPSAEEPEDASISIYRVVATQEGGCTTFQSQPTLVVPAVKHEDVDRVLGEIAQEVPLEPNQAFVALKTIAAVRTEPAVRVVEGLS
jgi:hypothetical protein